MRYYQQRDEHPYSSTMYQAGKTMGPAPFDIDRHHPQNDTDTGTHTPAEVRREIRGALNKAMAVGAICQALPHITRGAIVRELGYLVGRGTIGWNGCRGPGSKYVVKL